ncbi:TonB-dependent receptor domain-containing protein [Sphingobium aquiterrae]|uniref:TonB-dependent receptor domain-containing protein n=1 Tax=Sphingobium aquiterrae TaxID=2038656 RepID=UPI003017F3C6
MANGENKDADIVVTGTLIRGSAENAALPVAVISADTLQKRGTPSMLDIIKTLPSVGQVQGESNAFSVSAQQQVGAGSINLRGLGGERTLVLLNGRRIVASPGQGSQGVDTNLMPLSAIGRIEILKDGAAATYGSDAIGGVVNLITRTDLHGFDVSANYRYVPDTDGDYSASVAYGWSNDTVRAFISAGYQHRSELASVDRDWANLPYTTNPAPWGPLSNPGVFLITGAGGAPLGPPVRDANCAETGGYAGYSNTLPVCYHTAIPFDNLVEDENKYQIYGDADVDLGSDSKLHVEGLYARSDLPHMRFSPSYPPIVGPNGPGSAFTIPSSNPGFNNFLTQTGNAALIGTATGANTILWRAFGNGGNPSTDGLGGNIGYRKRDLYRVSANIDGKITDSINYNVGVSYSNEKYDSSAPDILIYRLQNALNGFGGPNCSGTVAGANGCQYLNPFSNAYASNPALGLTNPGFASTVANDPALVNWLFNDQRIVQEQSLLVFDALLSGKLGISLPGGDIGWAVGGQYRKGAFHSRTDNFSNQYITPCINPGNMSCTLRTGPYQFFGPIVPLDVSEEIYAAFGELSLPVTSRLNGQLAIRYEDYGGGTGSTVNPKFALKWQAIDGLALRGSVGTTFRGPSMAERAASGTQSSIGLAVAGGVFKAVENRGNPDIQPETAFTYSLGAIVETGGFHFSVDYWSYKLKDLIVRTPPDVIASAVAGAGTGTQFVNCASPLASLITFAGNVCSQGVTRANDIAIIQSDLVNGPTTNTSGLDFAASMKFNDIGSGKLTLATNASVVLKYHINDFLNNGVLISKGYDAVGYANYDRLPGTIARWRGNASIEYATGPHTFRLAAYYVAGVKDNRIPVYVQTGPVTSPCIAGTTAPNCKLVTFGQKVAAFTSIDANYQVELFSGTTLNVTVLNLFDKDPSGARQSLSYDPAIGIPEGRSFKIGVRYTF